MPSLASAKQWKEIKIATEAGYAPFEYRNTKGQLEGFDIDIGNEICARLKTKCVWIAQSFDSLIPGLKARKFVLANYTMQATAPRPKVIVYTKSDESRVGKECCVPFRSRGSTYP